MAFNFYTIFYSIFVIAGISFIISIIVSILYNKLTKKTSSIEQAINQINSLLPQTQCAQCDYPGCMPYARAIIENNAPINKCIPGGQETIKELANLLNTEEIPLDSENKQVFKKPVVVTIREDSCIGCTKCINVCPVDAIIGAPKQMHAILSEYCTGCMLCLPPCPMDCIDIIEKPININNHKKTKPV
tara:strand:+ start:150 stop:713 length:564 start_codon:yes stop_codon:yes gene_type:complete